MKCPKRVRFGDPMYFEEYKGKKLASLVADCKPPHNFVAKVVLAEVPMKGYLDEMSRTTTLCMVPKETIDTCVDGRYEEIHTGADGYWGNCMDLSRGQSKNRILDAMAVSVCMLESENFVETA